MPTNKERIDENTARIDAIAKRLANSQLTDVSDTTATAGTVAKGEIFYDKDGVRTEGSADMSNNPIPNPTWWDIETIYNNDLDVPNYTYSVILLFRDDLTPTSFSNGTFYKFSDGTTNTNGNKTDWDITKDKECIINGNIVYKTRYVIIYGSNSSLLTSNLKNQISMYTKPKVSAFNKQRQDNLEYLKVTIPDTVTSLSYAYASAHALKKIELNNTKHVTRFDNIFQYNYSLVDVNEIDVEGATNLTSMFNDCTSIKKIRLKNTQNVSSWSNIFYRCYSLEEIYGLDLYSYTGNTTFDFGRNVLVLDIKNIRASLRVGSGTLGNTGTVSCQRLNIESLINIIKELWDNTGSETSLTLTLGNTNNTKLSNIYVKLIDVTDEMRANDQYIDNKKPFELCESTDDGGMLITEYVVSKNWALA